MDIIPLTITEYIYNEAKAEGKAEGIAQGKTEGKVEGIAQGKTEGKVEGELAGELKALQYLYKQNLISKEIYTTLSEPLRRRLKQLQAPNTTDPTEKPKRKSTRKKKHE